MFGRGKIVPGIIQFQAVCFKAAISSGGRAGLNIIVIHTWQYFDQNYSQNNCFYNIFWDYLITSYFHLQFLTRSSSVSSWRTTSTWTPSVNISAPLAMSTFSDPSVTRWQWRSQKIHSWTRFRSWDSFWKIWISRRHCYQRFRRGLLWLVPLLWVCRSFLKMWLENELD